jgi:hypothetical protein
MRTIRLSQIKLVVAIALLAGLSACGGSSNQPADATHSTAKKSEPGHHGPANPAERSLADMVTAVSAGKGGPPVELKFELRDAPKAGQALEVDMAILTDAAAINRVYAQFSGGDGIDLVEGSNLPAIEKPAQGQVIRHLVQVLPQKDGIYTLNAAVTLDLADGSVTRTFTIPVIVGEGLAESGKPDNDGKDAAAGTPPKAR